MLRNRKVLESPNQDQRSSDSEVSLLVIHNISLPPGKFGGGYIEQFFLNQLDAQADPYFEEIAELKVSSHYLIARSGTLTEFVAPELRAWHAGVSCLDGVPSCNDYSIGIELEGTDDVPYTDAQYNTLIRLTELLQQRFPKITLERIVGHCDIAPLRKTDPGLAFDWLRYKSALRESTG